VCYYHTGMLVQICIDTGHTRHIHAKTHTSTSTLLISTYIGTNKPPLQLYKLTLLIVYCLHIDQPLPTSHRLLILMRERERDRKREKERESKYR